MKKTILLTRNLHQQDRTFDRSIARQACNPGPNDNTVSRFGVNEEIRDLELVDVNSESIVVFPCGEGPGKNRLHWGAVTNPPRAFLKESGRMTRVRLGVPVQVFWKMVVGSTDPRPRFSLQRSSNETTTSTTCRSESEGHFKVESDYDSEDYFLKGNVGMGQLEK